MLLSEALLALAAPVVAFEELASELTLVLSEALLALAAPVAELAALAEPVPAL